MSVMIMNRSIEPQTLPPPFGDLLPGLGGVVYEGSVADILARADLEPTFDLYVLPDTAQGKALPGWKRFVDGGSTTLVFGTNALSRFVNGPLQLPAITDRNLGQKVQLQRTRNGSADLTITSTGGQGILLAVDAAPAGFYVIGAVDFYQELVAGVVQAAENTYTWLRTVALATS